MENQQKNPLIITVEAKGGKAEIRITGEISRWKNSADEFRRQIDELINQGITDVELYLNTPGGSCFEANEIANEIERLPKRPKGFGGAMVASAGSYLAVICETFEMAENGQFMYHKPSAYLHGNEDRIAADLKLLQNLTKHYRKVYAEKTGMTEKQIEEKWSKGDVWLSAKEALEQKFITGISKPARITKEEQALFAACGAPMIPEACITEDKPNNSTMSNFKLNAAALAALAIYGLKNPEDSEEVNGAIARLSAAYEAEQNAHKAEKTAREALQKQLDEQKVAAATALVDEAVAAGKITAEVKDQFVEMAKANYELAAKVIGGMPAKNSLAGQVGNSASASTDPKNIDEFEKLSDEQKAAFVQANPEGYRKLFAS